jgi:hypothetical protein
MIVTLVLIGFGVALVAGLCFALALGLFGIAGSADDHMERLVADLRGPAADRHRAATRAEADVPVGPGTRPARPTPVPVALSRR